MIYLKQLIHKYCISILKFIIIVIILNLSFMKIVVPTGSMLPTIRLNDYLIAQRHFFILDRGDIIVFEPNDEEGEDLYIKRLIGLPGDTISFKLINGKSQLFVNNQALEESYSTYSYDKEIEKIFIVPNDCYFFLGDNRANSYDSRFWSNSYIHKSQIKGKVIGNLSKIFPIIKKKTYQIQ